MSLNASDDPLVVLPWPGVGTVVLPATVVTEGLERGAQMFGTSTSVRTPTATTEKLLNSQQMGELLGVDSTTVEAMAKDGRVPSIRIGRLLRFEAAVCLAALRRSDGRS